MPNKVGIDAAGGVEAVVKAMMTFPECPRLYLFKSCVLRNLALINIGTEESSFFLPLV